jgi:N-acetylglutamate synthase-like GNAT family acetyltransferase
VSADAVLLMTARIAPEFRGGGLGRVLVQAVARDIVRRGLRAIEAFGRSANGSADELPAGDPHACVLPTDYLRAVGFKTVRPHPRTPRLRLDVRSTVSWKEDVEYALERLLGTMQSPVLSR